MATNPQFIGLTQSQRTPAQQLSIGQFFDTPEEDEEERAGVVGSFLAGVGQGILYPVSALPGVRDWVGRMQEYGGDNIGSKVGEGVGFFGGMFMPGLLALRAGGAVVRGAAGAAGRGAQQRLLRQQAETRLGDLTLLGEGMRGSISGLLMSSASMVPEERSRAEHVLKEMALWGASDVAVTAGIRAIAGSRLFGRKGKHQPEPNPDRPFEMEISSPAAAAQTARGLDLIEDTIRAPRTPDDIADAIVGRGQSSIEAAQVQARMGQALPFHATARQEEPLHGWRNAQGRFARPTEARPGETPAQQIQIGQVASGGDIDAARLRARLQLEEMGLLQLEPGHGRIIPSVSSPQDTRRVLDAADNIDLVTHSRKVGDADATDFLVAPRGVLDQKSRQHFEQHGVIPGQAVIWKGRQRVVDRISAKGDHVLLRVGSKTIPAARNDVHFLDVAPAMGGTSPIDTGRWWTEFVGQHGSWPEEGFSTAFEAFARERGFFGRQKETLRNHFARRQRDALRTLDPETAATLERLGKLPQRPAIENPLAEAAAARGYIVEQVHRPQRGYWAYRLKDVDDGTAVDFRNRDDAMTFLRERRHRDMPELVEGSPIASQAFDDVPTPAVVTPAHTAVDLSGVQPMPNSWLRSLSALFLPRKAFIQDFEDALILQMGDNAPRLWSGIFEPVATGAVRANNLTTEWGQELAKIGGLRPGRRSKIVREEKFEDLVDMLETPRAQWGAFAKERGINQREVRAMEELREWFNRRFEYARESRQINITADDFLENYFPHMIRKSGNNWAQSARQAAKARQRNLSEDAIKFFHEMERQGNTNKYPKDPFYVAARYARSLAFAGEVRQPWKAALSQLEQLPNDGTLGVAKKSMVDYLATVTQGNPEGHLIANKAFKEMAETLGLNVSPRIADQFVNRMISWNHAAFMGFRPALALRNTVQTMLTTYPMLGGKYTGLGITYAVRNQKQVLREMMDNGALPKQSAGVAYEDIVSRRGIMAQMADTPSSRRVRAASRVGEVWDDLASKSMFSSAKLPGTNTRVPVGMYGYADLVNRMIAYSGGKARVRDTWNSYKSQGWDVAKFNQRSGLDRLGPAARREFHRIAETDGEKRAFQFFGKMVSDETQFMYQRAAGPASFSHGAMKILGQYGTWPSWYASYVRNGLMKGSGADRVVFGARTLAMHAAIGSAGAAMGLNMSRWLGLTSFSWNFGPGFHVLADVADMHGGRLREDWTTAQATPERHLALASYGLRHDPDALFGIPFGPHVRLGDGYRLWRNTLGMFIPGAYAVNDWVNASQEDDPVRAAQQALGFQLYPVGSAYPEMHLPASSWTFD